MLGGTDVPTNAGRRLLDHLVEAHGWWLLPVRQVEVCTPWAGPSHDLLHQRGEAGHEHEGEQS